MRSILLACGIIMLFAFQNATIVQRSTIVIVNDFNVGEEPGRKKKKELFAQLADSATKKLAKEVAAKWNMDAIVIENPAFSLRRDDMIQLLVQYKASRIIFLDWVDVRFHQTRVEVEKTDSGKERTAYYDICGEIKVTHLEPYKSMHDVQEKVCEHFTDRSVMSGLLAAGPDVVGKKKHTFPILDKAVVTLVSKL